MPLHQDGSISPRNCLLATAKFGAEEKASKPFAKDQLSLQRCQNKAILIHRGNDVYLSMSCEKPIHQILWALFGGILLPKLDYRCSTDVTGSISKGSPATWKMNFLLGAWEKAYFQVRNGWLLVSGSLVSFLLSASHNLWRHSHVPSPESHMHAAHKIWKKSCVLAVGWKHKLMA